VDDDVEYVPRAVAMEGSYHGHDGIRRWWRSFETRGEALEAVGLSE
jgi:hypothetical protein